MFLWSRAPIADSSLQFEIKGHVEGAETLTEEECD